MLNDEQLSITPMNIEHFPWSCISAPMRDAFSLLSLLSWTPGSLGGGGAKESLCSLCKHRAAQSYFPPCLHAQIQCSHTILISKIASRRHAHTIHVGGSTSVSNPTSLTTSMNFCVYRGVFHTRFFNIYIFFTVLLIVCTYVRMSRMPVCAASMLCELV